MDDETRRELLDKYHSQEKAAQERERKVRGRRSTGSYVRLMLVLAMVAFILLLCWQLSAPFQKFLYDLAHFN